MMQPAIAMLIRIMWSNRFFISLGREENRYHGGRHSSSENAIILIIGSLGHKIERISRAGVKTHGSHQVF
jgi:hypothetical protein